MQDEGEGAGGGWPLPACTFQDICSLPQQRQSCKRCRRPLRVCLCSSLPPRLFALPPHVSLLVLQHTAEARSNPVTCTVPILQAVIEGERQGLREAGYSNRGGKASSGELWRRERESVSPESGGGLCVVECSSKGVDGLKDRRVVRALRDKGSLVLYPAEGAKDSR
ncbi:hypothetical protein Naga_100312g1 [Nannochloropsis gaditana]|uniref:tRNA-uridine aminocarboxypropyltransferase n=1 Tax=Nannochloropsis gaditana TaxID=72520 RepID=W7TP88_9STRA|nr:hypothetical protein Naga_100312g1 [Nannochloropsis gaditana]